MFKPMCASNTKIKDLRLPTMVSKKLEGVRGEFTPIGLHTRPMKSFGNPWLEMHFAAVSKYAKENKIFIEGEFYKHGMVFSDISSICRRKHHPDTGDLELHIFDVYDPAQPNKTFIERHAAYEQIVAEINISHVKAVKQILISSNNGHDNIKEYYEDVIQIGYEGLCFKSPIESYKKGRSTHREGKFLRIKPDNTYDGIVLEIVERMENLVESEYNETGYLSKRQDKDQKAHTGMAAVAITKCEDFPEPVRVVLSKNLTDSDRASIWENRESYIGKHLRFYGIPVPGMDQPRCPRFDTWRTDLD